MKMQFKHLIRILLIFIKLSYSFDYLKEQNPPVFMVNKETAYEESILRAALLSNGNFVITWTGGTKDTYKCEGCYVNIYFYVYDPSGKKLQDDPIIVNPYTTILNMYSNIVADTKGGF